MYNKQHFREHCTVPELTPAELRRFEQVKCAARNNENFRAFLDSHPLTLKADMAEAEVNALHSYSWEHCALFADAHRYQIRAWIAVYDEWEEHK